MLLVLLPATASAKPNDAVQTFTGAAQGVFSGSDWQPVPGTRVHFVAPGRYGNVELVLDYRMTGVCNGCDSAILLDGVPAVGEEGALDAEGLAQVPPGSHRLQLAVRWRTQLDGPWWIRVEQVR